MEGNTAQTNHLPLEQLFLITRDFAASSRIDHVHWYINNLLNAPVSNQQNQTYDQNVFILHAASPSNDEFGLSIIEDQYELNTIGSGRLFTEQSGLLARKASHTSFSTLPESISPTQIAIPSPLSRFLSINTNNESNGESNNAKGHVLTNEENVLRIADIPGGSVATSTNFYVLSCSYRVVFVIDSSPSMAAIDPVTGEVLYDSVFPCLEKLLLLLSQPMTFGRVVFRPRIYISCILQGNSPSAFRVLLHGTVVSLDNVYSILEYLYHALISDEACMEANHMEQNSTHQNSTTHSQQTARKPPSSSLPSTQTFTDLGSPLRNAMFVLKMLPSEASPFMVLLTDGVSILPEECDQYDSLLMLMNRDDIVCSAVQIGSSYKEFSSFGFVPDANHLKHFVTCTHGAYFDALSLEEQLSIWIPSNRDGFSHDNPKHTSIYLNNIQAKLLLRKPLGNGFDLKSSERTKPSDQNSNAQNRSSDTSSQLEESDDRPFPWDDSIPQQQLFNIVFKKYHLVGLSIFQLLACRLREGFDFDTLIMSSNTQTEIELSIKMIFPWKDDLNICYSILTVVHKDIPNMTPEISSTLHGLAYYSQATNWKQFIASSQSRTDGGASNTSQAKPQTNQNSIASKLNQYWNCILDTDKQLLQLTSSTITLNEIIGRSMQSPLHIQIEKLFWKSLQQLPRAAWHRWFKLDRLEIVLSPDINFNTSSVTTASNRIDLRRKNWDEATFTSIKFDTATRELHAYLDAWTAFSPSKTTFAKIIESTLLTGVNTSHHISNLLALSSTNTFSLDFPKNALSDAKMLTSPSFCVAMLKWESKNMAILNLYHFGSSPTDRHRIIQSLSNDLLSKINQNDPSIRLFSIYHKPLRYLLIRYQLSALQKLPPLIPSSKLSLLSNSLPSLLKSTSSSGNKDHEAEAKVKQDSFLTDDVYLGALVNFSPIYHLLPQYMKHSRWIWAIHSENTQDASIEAIIRSRTMEGFSLLMSSETSQSSVANGASPIVTSKFPMCYFVKEIKLAPTREQDPNNQEGLFCVIQYVACSTPFGYMVTELWMEPFDVELADQDARKQIQDTFSEVRQLIHEIDSHLISTITTFDTLALLHNPHTTKEIFSVQTDNVEYKMSSSTLDDVWVKRPPFNLKGIIEVASTHEEAFNSFEKADSSQLHICLHATLSYLTERQLPNEGPHALSETTFPIFTKSIQNSAELLLVALPPYNSLYPRISITVYYCSRIVEAPHEKTRKLRSILEPIPAQVSDDESTPVITSSNTLIASSVSPTNTPSSNLTLPTPGPNASSEVPSTASSMVSVTHLCESLQTEHRRSYVKVLFSNLRSGSHSITNKDFSWAMQSCQEFIMEMDITQFFRFFTRHHFHQSQLEQSSPHLLGVSPANLQSVSEDNLKIRWSKRLHEKSPRQASSFESDSSYSTLDQVASSVASTMDTSHAFDRILAQDFQSVPHSDFYFFFSPSTKFDSDKEHTDDEFPVGDEDNEWYWNKIAGRTGSGILARARPQSHKHPQPHEDHSRIESTADIPDDEEDDAMAWMDDLSKRFRAAVPIKGSSTSVMSEAQTNAILSQASSVWSTFPLFLRMECSAIYKNANPSENPEPPHFGPLPSASSPINVSSSMPIYTPSVHHHHAQPHPAGNQTVSIKTLPHPKQHPGLAHPATFKSQRTVIKFIALTLPQPGGMTTPTSSPAEASSEILTSITGDFSGTSPNASPAIQSHTLPYTRLPTSPKRLMESLNSAVTSIIAQKTLDLLRTKTPVTRLVTDVVARYMQQLHPSAYIIQRIPLVFIDPQPGIASFFKEFQSASLQPLRTTDGKLFFVVNPIQSSMTHIPAVFTPNAASPGDLFDLGTSPTFNAHGSISAIDSYTIPYWLLLTPTPTHVVVRFQCTPGTMSKHEIQSVLDLTRVSIEHVCKRVNQIILLQQLYEARVCSVLLLPEMQDTKSALGKAASKTSSKSTKGTKSSTEDAISKAKSVITKEALDLDEDVIIDEAIPAAPKPPKATKFSDLQQSLSFAPRVQSAFVPGQFECELVHEIRIPLFWRTDPKAIFNAIANSTLQHFSVSNRPKMYVYPEESGRIFYMRLSVASAEELQQLSASQPSLPALTFGSSRESLQKPLAENLNPPLGVSYVPASKPSTPLMQRNGSQQSIIAGTSVDEDAPLPRVESPGPGTASLAPPTTAQSRSGSITLPYNTVTGKSDQEGHFLVLKVYGTDPPSEDITVQLRSTLESKVNHFTLQVLSTILLRNPLMKIKLADDAFLRPPELAPRRFCIELPSFVTDVMLFKSFMKSNMVKQGLTNLIMDIGQEQGNIPHSGTGSMSSSLHQVPSIGSFMSKLGRTPEPDSNAPSQPPKHDPTTIGDPGHVYLYNNMISTGPAMQNQSKSSAINFGSGMSVIGLSVSVPSRHILFSSSSESHDAGFTPIFESTSIESSPMPGLWLNLISSSEIPHNVFIPDTISNPIYFQSYEDDPLILDEDYDDEEAVGDDLHHLDDHSYHDEVGVLDGHLDASYEHQRDTDVTDYLDDDSGVTDHNNESMIQRGSISKGFSKTMQKSTPKPRRSSNPRRKGTTSKQKEQKRLEEQQKPQTQVAVDSAHEHQKMLQKSHVDVRVWIRGNVEVSKLVEHIEKIINQSIAEYQLEWYGYLAESREDNPMDVNQFICDTKRLLEHASSLEAPCIKHATWPVATPSWAIKQSLNDLKGVAKQMPGEMSVDVYCLEHSKKSIVTAPIQNLITQSPHQLSSNIKGVWLPYNSEAQQDKANELADPSSHLFNRFRREFCLLYSKASLIKPMISKGAKSALSSVKIGRESLANTSILSANVVGQTSSVPPEISPTRSFALMFLDSHSLTVFSYNWTNSNMEQLAQLLLAETNWLNLRQHALGNILHQKMGLFSHNPPLQELHLINSTSFSMSSTQLVALGAPVSQLVSREFAPFPPSYPPALGPLVKSPLPPATAQSTPTSSTSSSSIPSPLISPFITVTNSIAKFSFENLEFIAQTPSLSNLRRNSDAESPRDSKTSSKDAPSKKKVILPNSKLKELNIDELLRRISPLVAITYKLDPVFRHAYQFKGIAQRYATYHQVQQVLLQVYSLWQKSIKKPKHPSSKSPIVGGLPSSQAGGSQLNESDPTTTGIEQRERKIETTGTGKDSSIDETQLLMVIKCSRLLHSVKIPFFLADLYLNEDLFEMDQKDEKPLAATNLVNSGIDLEKNFSSAGVQPLNPSGSQSSLINNVDTFFSDLKRRDSAGQSDNVGSPPQPIRATSIDSNAGHKTVISGPPSHSTTPRMHDSLSPNVSSSSLNVNSSEPQQLRTRFLPESVQSVLARNEQNLKLDTVLVGNELRKCRRHWRKCHLDGFMDEYTKYLASFGVSPVDIKPSQASSQVDAPKKHQSTENVDVWPPKRQRYLQKVFRGGLILLELEGGGFENYYVSCNLFILFFNRITAYFGLGNDTIGSTSRTAASLRQVSNFTRECTNIKTQLHLNSFIYDYHIRQISQALSSTNDTSGTIAASQSSKNLRPASSTTPGIPTEADSSSIQSPVTAPKSESPAPKSPNPSIPKAGAKSPTPVAPTASSKIISSTPKITPSLHTSLSTSITSTPNLFSNATATKTQVGLTSSTYTATQPGLSFGSASSSTSPSYGNDNITSAVQEYPAVEVTNLLQALVLHYKQPPKHSRAAISTSSVTIDASNALVSPIELFAYSTKHAAKFGLSSVSNRGISPGLTITSQTSLMVPLQSSSPVSNTSDNTNLQNLIEAASSDTETYLMVAFMTNSESPIADSYSEYSNFLSTNPPPIDPSPLSFNAFAKSPLFPPIEFNYNTCYAVARKKLAVISAITTRETNPPISTSSLISTAYLDSVSATPALQQSAQKPNDLNPEFWTTLPSSNLTSSTSSTPLAGQQPKTKSTTRAPATPLRSNSLISSLVSGLEPESDSKISLLSSPLSNNSFLSSSKKLLSVAQAKPKQLVVSFFVLRVPKLVTFPLMTSAYSTPSPFVQNSVLTDSVNNDADSNPFDVASNQPNSPSKPDGFGGNLLSLAAYNQQLQSQAVDASQKILIDIMYQSMKQSERDVLWSKLISDLPPTHTDYLLADQVLRLISLAYQRPVSVLDKSLTGMMTGITTDWKWIMTHLASSYGGYKSRFWLEQDRPHLILFNMQSTDLFIHMYLTNSRQVEIFTVRREFIAAQDKRHSSYESQHISQVVNTICHLLWKQLVPSKSQRR